MENDQELKGVKFGLLIHAKAEIVYQTIRNLRADDPGSTKELSQTEHETVVEERFEDLPIISKASCTYRETYQPFSKIEYKMIKSDKFKAFEGAWNLRPENDGQDTFLELSSFVDPGLTIPFAQQIANTNTLQDVKKRLALVKRSAEGKSKTGS